MKVLVTGAAGFIGSALALRLLERGDEVIGVDNLSPYYEVLAEAGATRCLYGLRATGLRFFTVYGPWGRPDMALNPQGIREAKAHLPDAAEYFGDIYEALEGADAVVLLTEWNAYRGLDLREVRRRMRGNVFVDLRNVYEPGSMRSAGFEYTCVGRR